jgi:hypothetical protein
MCCLRVSPKFLEREREVGCLTDAVAGCAGAGVIGHGAKAGRVGWENQSRHVGSRVSARSRGNTRCLSAFRDRGGP